MKNITKIIIIFLLLFIGGVFSANAQDLIVLRDGNVIEARVTEISASEIRYKRFSHLDGPTIVVSTSNVLSIRYQNGTVEIFNAASVPGQSGLQANQQAGSQAGLPQEGNTPQLGQPTALQGILNYLPAIPIAGNNLKFEFGGESWVARVNGENFSAGTLEFEVTAEGGILTLTQTHIWPGAVGRTAGRIANVIPGGGAVGGVLNTAGNVAGTVGPVESSGTIVLEYRAGPPASLRLLSNSTGNNTANTRAAGSRTEKSANARDNWMSYELAAVGIGVRYERMLGSKISLGANIYGGFGYVGINLEINTFFRFYPWGKTFFLGLGIGYNHTFGYIGGFAIIPEIGWKIDVGNAGGFYLMPCIAPSFVLYGIGVARAIYFGMGHAF